MKRSSVRYSRPNTYYIHIPTFLLARFFCCKYDYFLSTSNGATPIERAREDGTPNATGSDVKLLLHDEITSSEWEFLSRFTLENDAVGADFVCLRIDFNFRTCVVQNHVILGEISTLNDGFHSF